MVEALEVTVEETLEAAEETLVVGETWVEEDSETMMYGLNHV